MGQPFVVDVDVTKRSRVDLVTTIVRGPTAASSAEVVVIFVEGLVT